MANEIKTLHTRTSFFDGNCESISTCASINRIILCLNKYQKVENLSDIYTECYYLANDFNHVLLHHLGDDKPVTETSEEYELIYNYMQPKLQPCELYKCKTFVRNNRIRETQSIKANKKSEYYIELMDAIHCYFIHSFDVGFRIKQSDLNHITNENNCNESKTEDEPTLILSDLSSLIREKKQKLRKIRGLKRTQNTKYVTDTNISEANVSDIASISDDSVHDEKQMTDTDKTYSFGHRYRYWNSKSKKYVTPKYKDLYIELLNNNIYKITQEVYKSILRKAKKICTTEYYKQMRAHRDPTMFLWAETIHVMKPPSISHIMSVLFYTDLSELSYHFSSSFRSLHKTDTYQTCKTRNREYFHLSKLLIELINLYGCSLTKSKIKVFYHGISELLMFSSFITIFNAPIYTTIQISVASIFAESGGAILELTKYHGNLKYFNCNWLSSYANEDERLFISPPHPVCQLRISSIISVEEDASYRYYVHALTTLDYVMRSQHLKGSYAINKMDGRILKGLFAGKQCPRYIQTLFELRVQQTKKICVRLNQVQKIKKVLFDEWNMFKFESITKVFSSCKEIAVNFHKYDGGTTFFHCGGKYFEALLVQLVKLNESEEERALKTIKFQKVKCGWKILKSFQAEYKKQNWNIMKTDKGEASGSVVISKCV